MTQGREEDGSHPRLGGAPLHDEIVGGEYRLKPGDERAELRVGRDHVER
jgi:hypothetical protein